MIDENTVNIGIRERRIRLILGFLFSIGSLWLVFWMVRSNPNPIWAVLLFLVLYQSVRFFFDYRTGTCPLKAELGQRKLDGFLTTYGDPIPDQTLVRRIRSKSRKAFIVPVGTAVVVTSGVLLLG